MCSRTQDLIKDYLDLLAVFIPWFNLILSRSISILFCFLIKSLTLARCSSLSGVRYNLYIPFFLVYLYLIIASLLKSNKLRKVKKSTLSPNLFCKIVPMSFGISYPILLMKEISSEMCTQPEQSLSIMLNNFKNSNEYTG